MKKLLGCAAVLAVFGSASALAAPLQNGSLESSANETIEPLAAGNTANQWTAVGNNIEFVKTGYSGSGDTIGAAADGLWFVDLNGTQGAGAIEQRFDTLVGQWYRVSFSMSGNAGPNGSTGFGYGSKTLSMFWDNSFAASASYAHQAGDNWSNLRWEAHGVDVLATGTTSLLRFQSTYTGNAAAGAFIDNIRVSAVPEPATAGLILAGLLLVGVAGRRRQAG